MKQIIVTVALLFTFIVIDGCQRSNSELKIEANEIQQSAMQKIDDPSLITVDTKNSDQILSQPVERRVIISDLRVPCKIILTTSDAGEGAQASLAFESSELSDAVSEYRKTTSQIEKLTNQVERLKDLVAHQAAAGKDLLDAETELGSQKTTLATLENKIRLAGVNVKRILSLPAQKAVVVADVPETQLRLTHVGIKADIILNSYPSEKIHSSLTAMGNIIDPLTRTVKVEMVLPNSSQRLLAGMYGEVLIDIADQSGIAVPVSSVFTALGKSFLFIERSPGKYERREVLTGTQGSEWIEITQGVSDNEKVVVKGAMLLKALSFGY
ncbi:MAG: efflux RND transporter periplasmic adaptor subunit [Bacteroidota bacterium]|nr:efflux RND transporter periplasmic adaptor subunit [Bacteroidota bacterium]